MSYILISFSLILAISSRDSMGVEYPSGHIAYVINESGERQSLSIVFELKTINAPFN